MKKEWTSLMEQNKASLSSHGITTEEETIQWWNTRKKIDKKIEDFLLHLQSKWLGLFRGIFCDVDKTGAYDLLVANVCRILQIKEMTPFLECFVQLVLGSLIQERGVWSRHKNDNENSIAFTDCLQYFGIDKKYQHALKSEFEYAEISIIPVKRRVVLIPCKELFDVPFENMPFIKTTQLITRVDSIYTLKQILERLQPKNFQLPTPSPLVINGVLNPTGDLTSTQQTFEETFTSKLTTSFIGSPAPTEQQFIDMLKGCNLFM